MDRSGFWELIEEFRAPPADAALLCERARDRLSELPLEELADYRRHFDALVDESYRWELWGAAYVIGGGCGDDSFLDFRAFLISRGREVYEAAHADPESLASLELANPEEDAFLEDFLYVAAEAYGARGVEEPPRAGLAPTEPTGEPWEESAVHERYPRLAERFGDHAAEAGSAPDSAPEPKRPWWKFW